MSYPHAMRLAGPWHFEVLKVYAGDRRDPPPEPIAGTARLPADWSDTLGVEFRGRVRYTRAFNRPTNLDPHESVWLVVEGADAAAAISLNGEPLGEFAGYAVTFERDVTKLLAGHNQLQIDVELPPFVPRYEGALRPGRVDVAGGLTGEVRLEVRARHFIHRLAVELIEADNSEVTLRVSGKVVGPERVDPLMLIVSGWCGELLATEVVAGKFFDVATAIERISRLEPGSDGLGGLAQLTIRLIEGGTRVWEKTIATGHRAMHFEMSAEGAGEMRSLAINGHVYPLPLRTNSSAWWSSMLNQDRAPRSGVAEGAPPLYVSERIFRDDEYSNYDRLGLLIVQVVPAAWIDDVCPRLAHHPSIVAWAVPRDWLRQGAGLERSLAWLAGSSRPWIATELVLAER